MCAAVELGRFEMPLYRYECESCGNQFTVLVRQQAPADALVCPDCGSKEIRRMVPHVAVQFKGSGYYKTDYARKGKASSSAGKASNNSKPGSGSSSSASDNSQSHSSQDSPSQGSKAERSSDTSSSPTKAASSE